MDSLLTIEEEYLEWNSTEEAVDLQILAKVRNKYLAQVDGWNHEIICKLNFYRKMLWI